MTVDFGQLRSFLEVCRLKSFSRAAEKIGISQPAVSAQVRSLETEVGERLLDRKSGNLTLTSEGIIFETFAERALVMQRHMLMMVDEQRYAARGEISIGTQESVSFYGMPEIFGEFKRNYGKVALNVICAERSKILDAIVNRELDFGVITLPVNDQRFNVEVVRRDELVLATPMGHPLCSVANVGPADIVKHSLLLPKQGRQRDLLLSIFRMQNVYPENVTEVDTSELMKRLVIAGLGVGFLPDVNLAHERDAGLLDVVSVATMRLTRIVGLASLKDKSLSHATRGFREIAISQL